MDGTAAIWRGDHRVRALEQDGASRPLRRRARRIHLGIGRAFSRDRVQFLGNVREKPREFPGMGRQQASRVQHAEQDLRVRRESRQRIRIQNDAPVEWVLCFHPRQRHRYHLARPRDPQPRPEAKRVEPPVLEQRRQVPWPLGALDHDAVQLRRMFGDSGVLADDRHQPRPDPQRPARRQPRRTARAGRAGQDQRVTVDILVIPPPLRQPWDLRLREGRVIDPPRPQDMPRPVQADALADDLAASRRPLRQHMPQLRQVKRHRKVRRRTMRPGDHPAAVGAQPRGKIDGDDPGLAPPGHPRPHDLERHAVRHRAREAGAEYRVDDKFGLDPRGIEVRPVAHLAQGAPAVKICPRIRRHLLRVAVKEHLDRPAPFLQQTRHDEPVAAVVARPAENHRPMRGLRQVRPFLENRLDHAAPGALHQLQPGHLAALDRGPFDLAHLRGCQEFAHAFIAADSFLITFCAHCLQNGQPSALYPAVHKERTLSDCDRRAEVV